MHNFVEVIKSWPSTELTGEVNEWNQVTDNLWQNKRCNSVFKGVDGRAYDINAKIYITSDGDQYVNIHDRHYISFPYTPRNQFIKMPKQPNS